MNPKRGKSKNPSSTPGSKNSLKVPPLVDFALNLTKLIIVTASISVIGISISAGASWEDIFLRGAVTLLSLGLLGWYLNWIIGKNMVEATLMELEEQSEEEAVEETENDEFSVESESVIGLEA